MHAGYRHHMAKAGLLETLAVVGSHPGFVPEKQGLYESRAAR